MKHSGHVLPRRPFKRREKDHAEPVSDRAARYHPPGSGQTEFICIESEVAPKSDPHSIASLSWMESVPYWLKQHETPRAPWTRLYKSSYFIFFFFIYLPFIKASTLDNNIVSLLDFWLLFVFFEHRATATPLALILTLSSALASSHIHARCIRIHSFFLSLSLSQPLVLPWKIFRSARSPCFFFHALLDSNVQYQFYDLNNRECLTTSVSLTWLLNLVNKGEHPYTSASHTRACLYVSRTCARTCFLCV